MKKIITLACIATALCSVSCKKDRTCTCTTTDVDASGSQVTSSVETVGHDTEGMAKKETNCYSYKGTITEDGDTYQETKNCQLK